MRFSLFLLAAFSLFYIFTLSADPIRPDKSRCKYVKQPNGGIGCVSDKPFSFEFEKISFTPSENMWAEEEIAYRRTPRNALSDLSLTVNAYGDVNHRIFQGSCYPQIGLHKGGYSCLGQSDADGRSHRIQADCLIPQKTSSWKEGWGCGCQILLPIP